MRKLGNNARSNPDKNSKVERTLLWLFADDKAAGQSKIAPKKGMTARMKLSRTPIDEPRNSPLSSKLPFLLISRPFKNSKQDTRHNRIDRSWFHASPLEY